MLYILQHDILIMIGRAITWKPGHETNGCAGRLGRVRWPHNCDDQHASFSETWTNSRWHHSTAWRQWHMNVEMRPSKISRFAWGKMPASKFATQKSRRCRGTQFRISWGFATSCSLQNQDFSESQIGELEGAHNGDHFLMIFGSDHALVDTEASKVIWHYALQIEVFRLLWLEFRASLSNRTTHLLLPRQMYLVSSKLATRVKNCEIDDFTILGILRMPVAISTDTNHYKHWLTDHSFRAHGEWAMATITKKSFSSLPEVQNRFKRSVTTMW